MATIRQCAMCGAVLTESAPNGQCPECLIQLGLRAGVASAADPSDGGFGLLPREFGDYTLLEEIARGGMGVVHRARQKSLGRIVAVKLILSGHFAGKDSIQRFRSEASSAAALQHPHIVAIHEVGVDQGEHYLAMDWVDGPNLAQFVKNQPLPAHRAARYLKTIAEAIQYAHERGILHRDLKPSNILIDPNDQPRVTDFGLAKRIGGSRDESRGSRASDSPAGSSSDSRLPAFDSRLDLTVSGQVLGSPNYIPPEQASGKRGQVSRQSDVYSLGAILYHLLTGRGPFVSDTVADVLQQVLHEEPVSPKLLNPSVPRDLETICLKCLQKEPARRYATARELADELDRFMRSEPIRARPASYRYRLRKLVQRNVGVSVSLAGLIVILLMASIISSGEAVRARKAEREQEYSRQKAEQAQARAESQEKIARREAYANMMLLAHESLELGDFGGVQELLQKSQGAFPDSAAGHFSASNAPWEWRHLQYEIRDEASVVWEGCTNSIYGMAVSQDDQWLAAGTTGGQVLLWHLPTQTLRAEWFTSNIIEHLCLSPDGQRLAIGNRDATVQVWAVPSGKLLARLQERTRILGLRFSADGHRLAFASDKGWSIANLEDSTIYQSPESPGAWRVAIANDFLCVARALVPQGLSFNRSGTNINFPEVVSNQYHGTGAAISPDGRWFALALADRSIEIWSLKEPRPVRRLVGHSADVVTLGWSADSRFLASGGNDQVVAVWNVSDGALLRRLQGHRSGIRVIAFSHDGSTIYSSSSDRTVRIFKSWATKPPVDRLDFPKVTYRSRLAAGARFGCARHIEGSVFFQTSPLLRFLGLPPVMEQKGRYGIAPDGALAIAASRDQNGCAIWRQTTSGFVRQATVEMLRTIHGHPCFSADGRRVALLGAEGSLAVWEVEPWRELRRWEGVGNREDEIVFDPAGNRVFVLVNPDGLFAGEIDTGRLIRVSLGTALFSGVAISVDNHFVAIAGDPTAVWAMGPGEEPRRVSTFPRLRIGAVSVAFSLDGQRLALGCANGQIQIWAFPDLVKVGVLKGHKQSVWSLAFSEDETLVSASPDQVRVWRALK